MTARCLLSFVVIFKKTSKTWLSAGMVITGYDRILDIGSKGLSPFARNLVLRSASVTMPCIFFFSFLTKMALEALLLIFSAAARILVSIGHVAILGLNMAEMG